MQTNQQTNSLFDCLGHPYRRETVSIVTETSGPITLDKLAREIAARSGLVVNEDDDSDSTEPIQAELYHVHLPKLADADLVEFNSDVNRISSTPTTTHLTALVEIAHSIAEVM